MKRLAVAFLALVAVILAAAPARAYCVVNQSQVPLAVTLQSANPLGDFHKTVEPGHKICCDWFDRRCNPTARREAIVTLTIETPRRERTDPLPGAVARYVPIPTFDRYGNPDPHGHYDRFGVYDPHGHKPYYEPIQTFDKYGNPDPRGHYDRYGVYDAQGHRGRHGRLITPKGSIVTPAPDTSNREKAHYCLHGNSRLVPASGGGTVTVTAHSLSPGGLRCQSRDHFLRPLAPPSQASRYGLPMLNLPAPKPAERRRLTE